MELRNSRFKLPTPPEPRQRKRKITEDVSTPEYSSPRSARLASRLKRLEESRDLPSAMQRRRMDRRQAEIRKRRDEIMVDKEDSIFGHASFVSARTFHRQLLAAVMKGDGDRVTELAQDSRMSLDTFTTQYSYADTRTPLVEAFASANPSLIMVILKSRSEKKMIGADDNLFEPLYSNVNYGKFFLPTVPSDDSLAVRKYAAPESMKEQLLTQLVRRNVPFSIIEKFRPVPLFLDMDELELGDGVNEIVKKSHNAIGETDGEFYTVDDYGSAAVEALRYGHCILAMNLARKKKVFTDLTEEIITEPAVPGEPFTSNGFLYARSDTNPYFLPIHAAAARSRVDVLEWYYKQYSNALNLKDEEHWLPLHYAAAAEDPSALKWLIAKGGTHQINFCNKQGLTALHVAVQAGRVENVKILTSSLEALDRLCLNSDHLPLENRTSLNWKSEEGLSALHIAARSGNLEIVEALCRHPFIDFNSKDKDGLTPFMIAASRGLLNCVEFLAKTCATQVDNLDRDALTYASINGQTNVVAFLLKSTTISHNSLDLCHNSALHYACAYGWLPIVKLLVEIDSAMLAQQNRKGLTPVVCAYRNGHFGIILWLVANGFEQFVTEDPASNDKMEEVIGEWMASRYDD